MERTIVSRVCVWAAACGLVLAAGASWAADPQQLKARPRWAVEVARDVSKPLSSMSVAAQKRPSWMVPSEDGTVDIRPERTPPMVDKLGSPLRGDAALQGDVAQAAASVGAPLANFEGLSNQDNANVFGFRVNPPDPVGAVGPNHYVQMINLVFAVYSKAGAVLLPPTALGALWNDFAVADCAASSGDPIVVYDQFADRWILSQFTSTGPEYFNCVAVSQTSDPTGAYYRYAFSTGANFPDYPKYGLWNDSYVITTREFGPTVEYGIGVYALEKNKLLNGQAKARMVGFFLDGNDPDVLPLVGDGLLPAYVDGKQKPDPDAPIPIVGTQDSGAFYGAAFDALNVFELSVKWRSTPTASLVLKAQLPVAAFDSIFPCPGGGRRCLAQPGATVTQYVDILSYRQRPTWRLAYRNFKTHEAMVTAQSVEAAPGVAGMRWYELRRVGGNYALHQQGTFAPGDGVQRWMGSVAMDRQGNIAMGYSVVNGTTVFPGIRYTGRLSGDALGLMTLGEGTIVNGTGIQRSVNSRWGDYTSLNLDPTDDCTFWYVNEYYTVAGQASSTAGWQTRIASFKLPGCVAPQ